jgi:hypothetical protein
MPEWHIGSLKNLSYQKRFISFLDLSQHLQKIWVTLLLDVPFDLIVGASTSSLFLVLLMNVTVLNKIIWRTKLAPSIALLISFTQLDKSGLKCFRSYINDPTPDLHSTWSDLVNLVSSSFGCSTLTSGPFGISYSFRFLIIWLNLINIFSI